MGGSHAANLIASPRTELAWVVDLDQERAASWAERSGGRATAEMDEALADPDVDAVVIALPTSLHRMATEPPPLPASTSSARSRSPAPSPTPKR